MLISEERLNHLEDRLRELTKARAEIRELKQQLCPYSHSMADWCSCGYSKATDTATDGRKP